MGTTVTTAQGTVIRHYGKTGVGKLVGHHLYVHQRYIWCLPESVFPRKILEQAVEVCLQKIPQWWCGGECVFNCARLDLKTFQVRFDEVSDFDTAKEPHLGRYVEIDVDGKMREGESKAIFHHKWLWIKKEYDPFMFDEAVGRSASYAPLLKEPPKSSDKTWNKQLAEIGLFRLDNDDQF